MIPATEGAWLFLLSPCKQLRWSCNLHGLLKPSTQKSQAAPRLSATPRPRKSSGLLRASVNSVPNASSFMSKVKQMPRKPRAAGTPEISMPLIGSESVLYRSDAWGVDQDTQINPGDLFVMPPDEIRAAARVSGMAAYEALCQEAESDYQGFWMRQARELLSWKSPLLRVWMRANRRFSHGLLMAC